MPIITPHRATQYEQIQWILEPNPGETQAATKIPLSLTMDIDPNTPSQEVESSGFKGPTDLLMEKDSTEASYKGQLDFNVLAYLFSITLCTGNYAGGEWVFFPTVRGPEVSIDTLTIEKGSSAGASRFSFASGTDIDIDLGLKGGDIKGKIIGTTMEDGITMSSPTEDIPQRMISPKSIDVYLGDSETNLVKLTNVAGSTAAFKAMWGMKNRQKGVMTLDSTQPSYSFTIEEKYGMTAQIVIEQDNIVAAGLFNDLRASNQKFCQIVAQGGPNPNGGNYGLSLLFPFKFKSSKRGDQEGVYAGTYDLLPTYNSTFNPTGNTIGGILLAKVQTDYATL